MSDPPRSTSVPTDEEYLDSLYSRLADSKWVDIMRSSADDTRIKREVALLIEAGLYAPDEREEAARFLIDDTMPERRFRGELIGALRSVAVSFLPTHRPTLAPIPVGLLPTRRFNGMTVRTPRGGAVILLDSGVVTHLTLLLHSYFACATWHDDEPYCPHCAERPQFDSAYTVVLLALFSVTGDFGYLAQSEIRNCPKLLAYDKEDLAGWMWPFLTEVFMMLHEYGHVLLKHLDPDASTSVEIAGVGVQHYTTSQLQEFEADDLAWAAMADHLVEGMARPTDIVLPIGICLRYLALCEDLAGWTHGPPGLTHPSARERWHRMKVQAGAASRPETLAYQVDYWFDSFATLLGHGDSS